MATLREAIASGRPFKRKDFLIWYRYYPEKFCIESECGKVSSQSISIGEAIASDWEIKPRDPLKCEFEANSDGRGIIEIQDSGYPFNKNFKVTIEEIIE